MITSGNAAGIDCATLGEKGTPQIRYETISPLCKVSKTRPEFQYYTKCFIETSRQSRDMLDYHRLKSEQKEHVVGRFVKTRLQSRRLCLKYSRKGDQIKALKV